MRQLKNMKAIDFIGRNAAEIIMTGFSAGLLFTDNIIKASAFLICATIAACTALIMSKMK